MCARYEEPHSPQAWKDVFELLDVIPSAPIVEGEVRPTDLAPIKRNTGARELEAASWWLRGPWDGSPGKQKLTLFNARDDKLGEAFWSEIAASQRCLVPATAYIEWPATGAKTKAKKRIAPVSGKPLAMAGLWNEWGGKLTHTVITTSPTADVAAVHDRMPVILPPELFQLWLSPERMPAEALVSLIQGRTRMSLQMTDATQPEAQRSLW